MANADETLKQNLLPSTETPTSGPESAKLKEEQGNKQKNNRPKNKQKGPRIVPSDKEVVVHDLTNKALFPGLDKICFDDNAQKFQVKKILLEIQANAWGKDYFYYNLLCILGDRFPLDQIMEFRMVVNGVLGSIKKPLILTDEEFLTELYG